MSHLVREVTALATLAGFLIGVGLWSGLLSGAL